MMHKVLFSLSLSGFSLLFMNFAFADSFAKAESGEIYTLPSLTVRGHETANLIPASTYESVVSNLDFDPRIDFQSRNMAEAQGDVSIRGGIFEGTGIQVGAATLIDPQTGHYSTELPIAPEMLGEPKVYTGAENALYGFNSTAGTIDYDWSQISEGGSATLGAGEHALNFQRLHTAWTQPLDATGEWNLGVEGEYSRSESDGTIQNGDHDFERVSGRIQLIGPHSQTDFFVGYQSKFFGWPAMYTANKFIDPLEYEDLRTRLYLINHQHNYGEDNSIELSLTHRRNIDDYQLDATSRTSGNPFTYIAHHETKVSSLGFNGWHRLNANAGVRYAGQFTADDWNKVDPYTSPSANASRSYLKLSILPEFRFNQGAGERFTFKLGGSFDDSNRDDSKFGLISELSRERNHTNGDSERVYLSYSEASQVPGYVAIGDAQGGPFVSNSGLGRERSQTLEIGGSLNREDFRIEGAIFYRWDNELVDWTYANGDVYARLANGVDLETFGIELIGSKRWNTLEAIASYTFLNKDEDYGDAAIDASFYALNFAKHRITLGAIWTPNDLLELRIDNEWRSQEANALRTSDDVALFAHIGLSIFLPDYEGLELFAALDNAWDDDYQDVPGTPGKGSQLSCGAIYRW